VKSDTISLHHSKLEGFLFPLENEFNICFASKRS
jgi:hypothetical protein